MTMRRGSKPVTLRWIGVWCLLATGLPACAQGPETVVPAPREGSWMDLHRSFLDRARRAGKEPVDLLFLGDSITQGWNDNSVWKRFYGPRNAANFGIGGDRTQHVLWRIQNGELEGIAPKLVVLMIGTNNADNATADEITQGISAIVQELRKRLPRAKVLLLGIFPRDDRRIAPIRDQILHRIKSVNQDIAKLDDGSNVRFLDISKSFLDQDGKISSEIMPDFLHLSTKGYRIWADAMEPTLWQMLDESRTTPGPGGRP
ncbi:MAG: platelet-activating factor acetylhydrolase IB subunit [Isosphaeraceae bacterium]